MKKRNGFTLIELLAVIVILAIIALIATPIILNIINDSREKSNQRSVESFQKSVETTVGQIMMDDDYTGSDIVCMLGSKITNEVTIENKENDETYCWDTKAADTTVKQVTYSGSRVKPDNIIYNRKTGDLVVLNAQVGSSKNKYSVNNNVATIVSALLKSDDGDNLFKDKYGNIRYRGKSPDNYVKFNNETWRIIGIIDGKVKLIRDELLSTNYAWDENNINDWSKASLQKYLNGDYYDSLDEISQDMIEEVTWNLGGYGNQNITSEAMYEKERGAEKCDECTYGTTLTGKIALMYPSDYGYAANAECSSINNLSNYNDKDSCKGEGNWLYRGEIEWLLTPISNNINDAWMLLSYGNISSREVSFPRRIRPTLNLKSSVKITGGEGTKDDPYKLQ